MRDTPDEPADLAALLSQLEESKFLRLFRHIVDSRYVAHDGLSAPVVPLDLPDAELMVKKAGAPGSMRTWTSTWIFQIEHLPSCLWQRDTIDFFIEARLRRAFQNLKARPALLDVLLRGVHEPVTVDDIGVDYYFFTNICQDAADDMVDRISETAQGLFKEILGVAEHPRFLGITEHPRFGLGTPETVAKYAQREVQEVIVDLLTMPSSYYLVAREGRVSIAPVTEHGTFFGSRSLTADPATVGLSTVATSILSGAHSAAPAGLSDLETLINCATTKEADLQEFFKLHPHFLFALDEKYCELRPHVCLFDAKREKLVPDFMARIEDSFIWDAIELKRPQHPLLVMNAGIEKISSFAARAVAELLQYRDFFASRDNRNRVSHLFETAPYEPCLTLVIGRGRARNRYEWSSIRAGFPRVQIVSYDFIFQRAQECSELLANQRGSATRAVSP